MKGPISHPGERKTIPTGLGERKTIPTGQKEINATPTAKKKEMFYLQAKN